VAIMAEIITCPACQRKLQVPESFYGQTVQCPECAHQFVADPQAQGVQTAPPPAADPPSDAPEPENLPRRRKRTYDEDPDDDFDDVPSMRRRESPHRGGLILTLGIIALVGGLSFLVPLIIGPFAWIMGNSDLAEIHAGRMDDGGEGMVQAGRILGIIATVFLLGIILMFCLIVGLVIMSHR
jgi:hypothetical protein